MRTIFKISFMKHKNKICLFRCVRLANCIGALSDLSPDFSSLNNIRTDELPCDDLDYTKICCANEKVKAKTDLCSKYVVDGKKHRYAYNPSKTRLNILPVYKAFCTLMRP